MDLSICLVPPELQQERGARAFHKGRPVTDHKMNPHTSGPAIVDWTRGYRRAQLAEAKRPHTVQQLDQVSPP